MMQDNYTSKGKHLTSTERSLIEKWRKEKLSYRQIAKRLGRSPQTINTEVKRGLVQQMDTHRRYHMVYSSEYAQRQYEHNRKRSIKHSKLDKQVSETIVHYIKNKFSPEVIAKVKLRGQVSTRTIYNWIYQGKLGLKRTDMLYPRKTKAIKKTVSSNPRVYGKSIDDRPEWINNRSEIGHWEIDTVLLTKSKNSVLLTLTERSTRFEVIRLIKAKTACAVNSELLRLSQEFEFKSIIADNGSEFSRLSEVVNGEVYYAHAYASWERGTNENNNRMIRRFLPKGTVKTTVQAVAHIEKWMNNYPRQLFNYKSPIQMVMGG
jgi:transposase, IS30 family